MLPAKNEKGIKWSLPNFNLCLEILLEIFRLNFHFWSFFGRNNREPR